MTEPPVYVALMSEMVWRMWKCPCRSRESNLDGLRLCFSLIQQRNCRLILFVLVICRGAHPKRYLLALPHLFSWLLFLSLRSAIIILSIVRGDGLACWTACRRCIQWYISYVSSITQVIGYGSSFMRFLDHTQRRTTVGRTPLDEWSARRIDLYLTTQNNHNRQTSMPTMGFEPTNLSRRAGANLRLRPRRYWQRIFCLIEVHKSRRLREFFELIYRQLD
jgi:hypothetical protein